MKWIELVRAALKLAIGFKQFIELLVPEDPQGNRIPSVDSQWHEYYDLAKKVINDTEIKIRQHDERKGQIGDMYDRRA